MLGRRIGLGLTVIALLLGAGESAVAAEWPPGPRLAYVREGPPLPTEQLINADPSGERWFNVVTGPSFGVSEFDYSPDGSTLAIVDIFAPGLLLTSANHYEPRPLRDTAAGFAPVFSPDGGTIAFSRLRLELNGKRPFLGASIWRVPARGGRARQTTPWRNRELLVPAAFSVDGSSLVAERQVGNARSEVVLQQIAGGKPRRIAANARDAAISPDGLEIAVVREVTQPPARRGRGLRPGTDIFVLDASGHVLRRLTRTPGRIEEDPDWDPSGERLVFTQMPAKEGFFARRGDGSSIVEINADGSCRRKLAFTLGLAYHDPAWQPGPGRGAGRIAC